MVGLIDTHAHLYATELVEIDYINNAIEAGLKTVLMPNIDNSTIDSMLQIASNSKLKCVPMLGLHPCYVKADYENELNIIFSQYQPNTYCAIGEIGLDLHWDLSTQEIQEKALLWQVNKAIELNLPIALHTRAATSNVIQLLTSYKGKVSGVFHCFGDDINTAQQIIDLGFKLGIGGVVTFKNNALQKWLKL